MVAVQDTQVPPASAAEKCVVCFSKTCSSALGGVPCPLTGVTLVTSILAASCRAYSLSASPFGTLVNAGSPSQKARSAKASFIVSAITCGWSSLEIVPLASRMLSIWATCTPPELGGGNPTMRRP